MRFVIILFLTIFFSYVKGLMIYFFSIYSFTEDYLGQTTEAPNYSCDQNNNIVEFTLSYSNHSAWNSVSNCSLQQCYESSSDNNSCLLSLTPCYDYRTFNNISYCASGILCSILEPCDNMTNTCASNTSVCIVNSCCSSQPVCLPVSWTNLCILGNDTF
jgi:hypothetical protein